MKKVYLLFFIFTFSLQNTFGQASILSEGSWFKIPITANGVYKIDKSFLEKTGINLQNLNPHNIQVFGSTTKLLPQPNSSTRAKDLQEISVFVNDSDGKFDKEDYILFYAENPDDIYFDSLKLGLVHEQHPYSNKNFVFLKTDSKASKKIKTHTPKSLSFEPITSLTHFEFYEPEYTNLLNSGREWLGEYFFSEWKYKFEVEGYLKSEPVSLGFQFVGQTFEDTELAIIVGGEAKVNVTLPKINYRWNDYFKRYNRAGEIAQGVLLTQNQELSYTFQLPNDLDISSGVYLDYFDLSLKREIKFYPKQHQAYLIHKNSVSFNIPHNSAKQIVWNVSDLFNAEKLNSSDATKFQFQKSTETAKLAFFNLDNLITPTQIESVPNQNLAQLEVPDLLIVYPKYFEKEVKELADFRVSNDKLKVASVEIQTIYNEFSGGKTDPTAIRDFARSLWLKDPNKLKYLLLFGDTNFDMKGSNNLDYVKQDRLIPTYESKESLEPIYSYSSDDYFGFLEDHEGEWPEGYSLNGRWKSTSNRDHSLDISIGRLPVKERIEAKLLVDKIIYYNTNKGSWKRKISFVADDADLNIHQRDAETFSEIALQNNAAIRPNKIYLDAFPQLKTELGERSPLAKSTFEKAISEGSLIINYNGHGSEDGWTDEKLLTLDQILRWRNKDKMPILFTATCAFGRYDNPAAVSGAEAAILNPNGGAIALLTTTRPVFSSTNFKINQAFYNRIFSNTAETTRLGDIFKDTKNNSIDGEVNRNFSLLGDPSMAVVYPKINIALTSINGENPEGTVINGLSKVSMKGQVADDNFNGTVDITLYDKAITKKTIGADNYPSMNFKSIESKLFEGKAKVINGKFESTFSIPKSVNEQLEKGHFYFYAISSDSTKEAIGGFNNFLIGGTSEDIITDANPPVFEMNYFDKEQLLIIKASDESGINISYNQQGKAMVLVLNDTLEIPLHDYYSASEDAKNGEIIYMFSKLPAGKYSIKLKLADVYNNAREEALNFTINEESLTLTHYLLYPNPANDIVSLKVEHNKIGEDLRFEISFLDISGRLMAKEIRDCYSCEASISFGMNLESYFTVTGRYFYQVIATQLSNNDRSSKGGKFYFWK